MSDQSPDRRAKIDAARKDARLLLFAVLVGVVAGFGAFVFLVTEHYVIELLWTELPARFPQVPASIMGPAVVIVMTILATLVVVVWGSRPFDAGHAAQEFDDEGRMEYRNLVPGFIFAVLSLGAGAAVGPEAALTDINGGLGTFLAEKAGLTKENVKTMAYAGVAGAFGAFFGAAPVGALLAIELISPRSAKIDRSTLVAGLGSGASAWVVYQLLGGHNISPMFALPSTQTITLPYLVMALVLGLIGGLLGLVYGGVYVKARVALAGMRKKPWIAALAGGSATALAAAFSPYLLFSGQTEVPQLLQDGASMGVMVLLGLGVGKLALSIWNLSTAYFGGPIFPLIFSGTCFGLAISVAMPFIPPYVAILGIATGLAVSASAAPLSVTIFMALLSAPEMTSLIAIAAVAAFVIRQAIAPTIPGVYRQANAAVAAAAQQSRE